MKKVWCRKILVRLSFVLVAALGVEAKADVIKFDLKSGFTGTPTSATGPHNGSNHTLGVSGSITVDLDRPFFSSVIASDLVYVHEAHIIALPNIPNATGTTPGRPANLAWSLQGSDMYITKVGEFNSLYGWFVTTPSAVENFRFQFGTGNETTHLSYINVISGRDILTFPHSDQGGGAFGIRVGSVTAVPEPGYFLLLSVLAPLGFLSRKRGLPIC